MKNPNQNPEQIENLVSRGISAIYPSKEALVSKLSKGEKIKIYLGIDPTGPTLHLGHAIPIKKLSEFQKAGHEIILLMGDFTAMIGDPDKLSTRVPLTHKQVLQNLKNYKKQASKLISFSGKNKAKIVFNSKWLGKMNFYDVLDLASKITVQNMLDRDMFKKRIEEGRPIFIHEFMYPLMQGYDSVAIDTDAEIGGNDQIFNMLCGRDLLKTYKNKEKFVIAVKLLEDNSGKKMGKTEGNMVALNDSKEEMFGKVMSWTDGMIVPGFEMCTDISMEEIKEISNAMDGGSNPKEYKMKLAFEIVKIFFGENEASRAKESWQKTFEKSEIPDNIEEVVASEKSLLMEVLVNNKVVSSNTDFRRLVDEGAITYKGDETKVSSYKEIVKEGVYKIGKKRFCNIKLK